MPLVSFTDHAKQRCHQQGLSIPAVAEDVKTIPPTTGQFKWYFHKHRYAVVVHYYPDWDSFVVITVISLQKMDGKKRFARGR